MTNCQNCEHYGNGCEGMRNPWRMNNCQKADTGERRPADEADEINRRFEEAAAEAAA